VIGNDLLKQAEEIAEHLGIFIEQGQRIMQA